MDGRKTMKEFEFCIIASGLDPEAEDFEQRFYDAGCDDATVAFQKGRIIVDFTREANSIEDAIVSALKGVEAAGARVERIEPDPLVSLSDIAARSGMSRAAMTQYSKGQRGTRFPAPVARVISDSPLWDWATVAKWLFQKEKINRETAIEAEAIRAANAAIGQRETKLQEVVRRSLRSYEKRLGEKEYDDNGLTETAHLLKSPVNAVRLLRSIGNAKRGKLKGRAGG
jgi:transcriptional regulator with XRE-family HTH domain